MLDQLAQAPGAPFSSAPALCWLIRRLRWENRLAELEHAHAVADNCGPTRRQVVERATTPAISTHGG